jgi:hypothetical protein
MRIGADWFGARNAASVAEIADFSDPEETSGVRS